MTSKAKEILEKAKKDLDNTIFPEGTPEYLKKIIFNLNKSELNDLLDSLERLEQFEEENQELKEQRLSLSLQLQDYKLIKEITLPNVLEENEKLKKAIEILKDKFELELINEELHFNTYECDTREIHELYDEWFYNLTKQENDLLKEIFEVLGE